MMIEKRIKIWLSNKVLPAKEKYYEFPKEELYKESKLSLKFLIIIILVIEVVNCHSTSSHYVLKSSYTKPSDAREKLGLIMERKNNDMPVTNEIVFNSIQIIPENLSGQNILEVNEQNTIATAMTKQIVELCGINLDIGATTNLMQYADLDFYKVFSPLPKDRRFNLTTCCDGKNVKSHCKGKNVITSIYETKATFRINSNSLINKNGNYYCSGGKAQEGNSTNAQISFATMVGSNNTINIQSHGWNIVQLTDIEDVCRNSIYTVNQYPIQIVNASYGLSCGNASGNRTAKVRELCQNKNTCSIQVNNSTFAPDPFLNCAKDFSVSWTCNGSKRYEYFPASTNEEYFVTLDCK
jgi:hypothetical protein